MVSSVSGSDSGFCGTRWCFRDFVVGFSVILWLAVGIGVCVAWSRLLLQTGFNVIAAAATAIGAAAAINLFLI